VTKRIEILPRMRPKGLHELFIMFIGSIVILLIVALPIVLFEMVLNITEESFILFILLAFLFLFYYLIVTIRAITSITTKLIFDEDGVELKRWFLRPIKYPNDEVRRIERVSTLKCFLIEVSSLLIPTFWLNNIYSCSGLAVITPYNIVFKNGDQVFFIPQDDNVFQDVQSEMKLANTNENE